MPAENLTGRAMFYRGLAVRRAASSVVVYPWPAQVLYDGVDLVEVTDLAQMVLGKVLPVHFRVPVFSGGQGTMSVTSRLRKKGF